MPNNKFQVQLGQIFDVHTEILGISCKNVSTLVFLYVQIRRCDNREFRSKERSRVP